MAYTTVDKVIEMLPHREIDNDSTVTLIDIEGFIASVNKIIDATLKIAGHDVTAQIVSASYSELLETIETLMVAGWVEQRFKGDTGGDEGEKPNNNYYKEGSNLLKALADNNEFDPPASVTAEVDRLADGTDELAPVFKKGVRDW